MKEPAASFIHRPVRTGALTLLITTVLICLSVLSVLALTTARADLSMAEKGMAGLQSQAKTEQAGQEALAALDAALKQGGALPEGAELGEDGVIRQSLTGQEGTLQIVLEPKDPEPADPAAYRITAWRITSQWTPDQSLDLWNGL